MREARKHLSGTTSARLKAARARPGWQAGRRASCVKQERRNGPPKNKKRSWIMAAWDTWDVPSLVFAGKKRTVQTDRDRRQHPLVPLLLFKQWSFLRQALRKAAPSSTLREGRGRRARVRSSKITFNASLRNGGAAPQPRCPAPPAARAPPATLFRGDGCIAPLPQRSRGLRRLELADAREEAAPEEAVCEALVFKERHLEGVAPQPRVQVGVHRPAHALEEHEVRTDRG